MTNSKVDVSPQFENQSEAVRLYAAAQSSSGASSWFEPGADWSGKVHDSKEISKAFPRDDIDDQFTDATSDADDPGVSGDLVAATIQADYVGAAERAFRSRHLLTNRAKAAAHVTSRQYGHGHESGTIAKTSLEFVRGIVKSAKTAQNSGAGN